MSSGKTSRNAEVETGVGSATPDHQPGNASPGAQPESFLDAMQVAASQRCTEVLQAQLSTHSLDLLKNLTGLTLHAFWQHPLDQHLPAYQGLLCPAGRLMISGGQALTEGCRACLERQWHPAVLRSQPEWRIAGACGRRSLVFAVPSCGPVAAFFVVQCEPGAESDGFRGAASLLRLIVHDLEATLEVQTLRRALDASRGRREEGTRNGAEDDCVEDVQVNKPPGAALPGRHARQVVQIMLDYVRDHYHKPMALKEIATSLGMNANYLSGLFHRATGMTFHGYVHAIRMSKAEELLRDPRARIREVAAAVGYLSPNHFRSVFKACEKLSPSAWSQRQETAKAEKPGAFLRGPP